MQKLKYLAIFLLPATVGFSFMSEGWWTFVPAIVFFYLVPFIELMLPEDASNPDLEGRNQLAKDRFYDVLLYCMVPVQYGFLFWYLSIIGNANSYLDQFGQTLGMGMMCGIIGINVGHELGHRSSRFERLLGELLLLTSLENHFIPYHNRGHHMNVATHKDPATARKNEWLYQFWFRSQIGSYFQAWKIEMQRMIISGYQKLNWRNKMVQYVFFQLIFILSIYMLFDLFVLTQFLKVALIGILLLETVNYIEHYGLLRKQRDNGTYERVRRSHSWNSNHLIGRAVLFELSRHSDHHYKPDRPYQLLESHDESPTMPTGYPGMMLLAFLPPLYFRVMNKRLMQLQEI